MVVISTLARDDLVVEWLSSVELAGAIERHKATLSCGRK